ncbi:LemA family protein [Terriglobus aquaticus]|uniref:LemA family protein n=1 Tax=Terriglobus aquaticus TaxID=940139 RepID=A0ABW9KIA4_9BACT|nr:LemA family protein [Terriglobus aquaticus]
MAQMLNGNTERGTMRKGTIAGLVVVVLLVLGVVLVGGSYVSARNSMAVKSNAVDEASSEIGIQLQRRADLIPNLVSTVKQYAKVETQIITAIAEARSGLLQAQTPNEKLAANDRLNTAILPLLRMQENYPDLKSNQQFLRLEDELSGTENRVAVARRRYNQAILDYNNTVTVFPNSVWAGIAGFQKKTGYFEADPASKAAPKVDFGS